jgi:DtxR family Mn-dependent transcriptional regulator
MLVEDFLKHIHARELQRNLATTESLAGSFQLARSTVVDTISTMEEHGLLTFLGNGIRLTEEGNQLALHIVRAHRLLERYLFDELGMPLSAVHAEADRREHSLSAADLDELDARLGYPRLDPHGDPIPTGSGKLAELDAVSLVEWSDGRAARIVHLEDEPPELFDRILQAGLMPGMHIEILERDERRLVLFDGSKQYVIPTIAATNVFVRSLPHAVEPPTRLSDLARGEVGRIRALECSGFTRRRMLDLGLTPGTRVEREFNAPLGEPGAYRVREALIALRKEDAFGILIERVDIEDVVEPSKQTTVDQPGPV